MFELFQYTAWRLFPWLRCTLVEANTRRQRETAVRAIISSGFRLSTFFSQSFCPAETAEQGFYNIPATRKPFNAVGVASLRSVVGSQMWTVVACNPHSVTHPGIFPVCFRGATNSLTEDQSSLAYAQRPENTFTLYPSSFTTNRTAVKHV